MVTPYMDHDLSGLLENPAVTLSEPQIKCYMLQLLEGVRYLHSVRIELMELRYNLDTDGVLETNSTQGHERYLL
jgi:serine/threonine protein kinase